MDIPYVVVVTGANRGLGLEFVRQILSGSKRLPFVPADAVVIATARDTSRAAGLDELKSTYGGRLRVYSLDQSSTVSIADFAANLVADQIGRVDLLICNAGIIEENPASCVADLNQQEAVSIFQTNSIGPILLTNALMPLLNNAHIAHGGSIETVVMDKNAGSDKTKEEEVVGEKKVVLEHSKGMHKPKKVERPTFVRVVYTSSSMGSIGAVCNSNVPTYRASKAALNMYVRCLSFEHPHIAFMPLHPGWVQTDMGKRGERCPPTTVEQSIDGCLQQVGKCVVGTASKAMHSFDGTTWVW